MLMRGMGGIFGGEWRVKSGELDGEWRVKSGEWREVWGNVCGHRGTERTGNVSRAGWPARVPCNPAPTVEFVSVTNPQSSGRQGCACGRGMPRPYEWGNIRGRRGTGAAAQCSCGPDSPQGCPAIRPLQMGEYLRPSRDRADRQRAAGRMARKGALQSGSYG